MFFKKRERNMMKIIIIDQLVNHNALRVLNYKIQSRIKYFKSTIELNETHLK